MKRKFEDCPFCALKDAALARYAHKLKKIEEALKANDFYKAVAWCEIPPDMIISDYDWQQWSK